MIYALTSTADMAKLPFAAPAAVRAAIQKDLTLLTRAYGEHRTNA